MSDPVRVIYNGSCPICSREIGAYRARAEATGAPLRFEELGSCDLAPLGLTEDAAARRFHVVKDGRLIDGIDAFIVLWSAIPGLGRLARIASLWPVRPIAAFTYDRLAAPVLYALHRRRQARRG